MKNLILLFAVMSFNTFGESRLSELMRDNPDATKREVLEMLYKDSSLPAELKDFDFVNEQSNQRCTLAYSANGLYNMVIKKIRKENITKLDIARELSGDGPTRRFEYITMESDAYDLIVKQKKNEHHDNSPFVLKLRKNGDLISFQILMGKHDNGPLFDDDYIYGYCWRE